MNSKPARFRPTLGYLAVIPLIALGILSILATGGGGGGGGGGGDGSNGGGCNGGPPQPLVVNDPIDSGTLLDKVLFGYQGWFAAPGDGSAAGWRHWSPGVKPNGSNITVDLWPDLSESDADELFDTGLTFSNGQVARVFSSHNPKTVMRHFRWMWENGLDGVFLQRFVSELNVTELLAFRNDVARNVRDGAETFGRGFAIMYDISGANPATLVNDIKNDWAYLVNCLKVTESPYYLRQSGQPVLAIWGFGFNHLPAYRTAAPALIDYLKNTAPVEQRVFLMGGVPYYWRTSTNDSHPNYLPIYNQFDLLSPWSVGRFTDQTSFDNLFNTVVLPDKQYTDSNGLFYAPVIWPGFSWTNLMRNAVPRPPLNQIPRDGGRFFWKQASTHFTLPPMFYYVAMFDEVDESTAMFKAAATAAEIPVEAPFVHYSIDGEVLPSDWYLRLSGAFAAGVRGEIPIGPDIPISP